MQGTAWVQPAGRARAPESNAGVTVLGTGRGNHALASGRDPRTADTRNGNLVRWTLSRFFLAGAHASSIQATAVAQQQRGIADGIDPVDAVVSDGQRGRARQGVQAALCSSRDQPEPPVTKTKMEQSPKVAAPRRPVPVPF